MSVTIFIMHVCILRNESYANVTGRSVNSSPASGDFSSTDSLKFENSLEPDHARKNVGPELNPNCLTL